MFISQHHCSIAKFAILSTVFAGAVVCQSVAQAQRTPVEIIHDMGVQLINGDGVPVDLIKGVIISINQLYEDIPSGSFI
nr:hypothetical protein [Providencia stuartii]